MSAIVRIVAEDADELLNAGAYGAGAIIRVQSAATSGGAYADLTGTGSTPTIPLVAGDRTYTAYDPNGTATTWYRTRYENAGATRLSDWSTVFQVGTGDRLCTVGQVLSRLIQAGQPTDNADDELLDDLIVQVSDWIQHYTGRKLVPETGVTYVFDTFLGYVLHVPRGVRAITSMGVASTHQPDSGGAYTSIPAADQLLRPKAVDLPTGWPATQVWISRGSLAGTVTSFSTAQNGCTITGDFGFAQTPPDIQAVAIDAVVAAYQARKLGTSGVIGADDLAIVPWSQYFGKGSPQRQTLDRYLVFAV
jgi:hypothetical protein